MEDKSYKNTVHHLAPPEASPLWRLLNNHYDNFEQWKKDNRPYQTFLLSTGLAILRIQHITDALKIISSHLNRPMKSALKGSMAFSGPMCKRSFTGILTVVIPIMDLPVSNARSAVTSIY